jgi:DNA-binding LacI/PurR family transcriptional regulator
MALVANGRHCHAVVSMPKTLTLGLRDSTSSIAQETRSRVMVAAEELDYRPNLLARSLAKRRTGQVAIVFSASSTAAVEFVVPLCSALQRQEMLALVLPLSDDLDLQSALDTARERRMDAAILVGWERNFQNALDSAPAGLRCFVLGAPSMALDIGSVYCAFDPIMEALASRLAARCRTRPAMLSSAGGVTSLLWSFESTWKGRGSTPRMIQIEREGQGGVRSMNRLLSDLIKEGTDCLLCSDYELACRVHEAARHSVLSNDIASYGPTCQSASSASPFTLIRAPVVLMARKMADLVVGDVPLSGISVRGTLIPPRSR